MGDDRDNLYNRCLFELSGAIRMVATVPAGIIYVIILGFTEYFHI